MWKVEVWNWVNRQPSHRLEKSNRGTDKCNHDRDDQKSGDDKQLTIRQLDPVAKGEHSDTADAEECGSSTHHDCLDISFEQEGLQKQSGFKSLSVNG